MELLGDSIKCKYCSEILIKPVLLPCGNSICKSHEEESREKGVMVIYCATCANNHAIPETNGFPRCLALESLIEKKIENLDLGYEYRAVKNKYNEFSDLLNDYEKLKNNPEMEIHEKMSRLRNKVDLRREKLKSRIDEDALKIIAQLDDYEAKCKANLASIKVDNQVNEKIDVCRSDMSRWKKQMNTFTNNAQFYKNISEKCELIRSDYDDFDARVFLNRYNDYSDLYLSIGNDYDLLKNHSMRFVVKNVSKYKDAQFVIESDVIRAFGLDWSIIVVLNKDEQDQNQYVCIYLSYNPVLKTEKVEVRCDLVIVNRIDPNRSIRNDCLYIPSWYEFADKRNEDICNNGNENHEDVVNYNDFDENYDGEINKLIKFDDLINNPELYDAENDSFTAQIDIKTIDWQ